MKGREWYQEDDTAEEYDEWRFSRGGELVDEAEKEALFELCGDIEGSNVLEIACGTGRFSVELARRGAMVTGVDISREMLRQGLRKARASGEGQDVDFLRGDGSRLPFPDGSFDLVVSMRFFHLVEEPADYLREMVRVSRGPVVFDTFREPSARLLYNRFLPMGSHLYTDDEVEEFVADSGGRVVERSDDFVLPFGLYRATPKTIARGFRRVDEAVDGVGSALSSVSYWKVE